MVDILVLVCHWRTYDRVNEKGKKMTKKEVLEIIKEIEKSDELIQIPMSSWDTWTEPAIMVDDVKEILLSHINNRRN